MSVSPLRLDDRYCAFHVRSVVIDLGDRRQPISPYEAQLLLGELGRLPKARYAAAEATAVSIVEALAGGCAVSLDDEELGAMLRAIEGVRVGRGLTAGLSGLRGLLVRSTRPSI